MKFLLYLYFDIIYLLEKLSGDFMKFQRLKDLREDNDKLQKDIANVLGISQQYYSEYEQGNRTIPTEHLMKLAIYYHTSMDYLAGLTNEIKPYERKK